MNKPNEQSSTGSPHLKAYTAPTLTEYGSVAKLTMGKGSTVLESPTAKKTCL